MPMRPKHKNTKVKMVLCVRQDLKMKTGKVSAQCSHAAIGLYKKLIKSKKYEKMLDAWENNGQKKIVAKLNTEKDMNLLISKATDAGILFEVITDAGRTQVAAGSRTVVALIDFENKLDTITGRYKLM